MAPVTDAKNVSPFVDTRTHAERLAFSHGRVADPSGAVKADTGKADLALIFAYLPQEALMEIAKVMDFGAKKYSANNWRLGFKWMRVFGSLLRHLWAWVLGEDRDPETGLSHMAHAGCNVLFLLTFILTQTGTDDRIKK